LTPSNSQIISSPYSNTTTIKNLQITTEPDQELGHPSKRQQSTLELNNKQPLSTIDENLNQSNYKQLNLEENSKQTELEKRNRYKGIISNIPTIVHDSLLLCQLKKYNVQAVHILNNRYGNQRQRVYVYFKSEKKLIQVQKYNIYYYNTKLEWQKLVENSDVCHINKEKRPSYKVGTTGVQKRARNLKVKQDHRVVKFVANKVATGSNSVDERKNIENFDRLKIGVYNINGLRLDEKKLQREKEGKWLDTKHLGYASFWSKCEEDKNKGAGVGILVREYWQKHIGKVIRFSSYLIKIEFFFRKVVLQ
ncbi:30523_t:CDS:2, partial [Gigaspora margarita]